MRKKQIAGIAIAVLVIAIYSGMKMYLSNVAAKKVDEVVAKFASIADIEYKKVSVDLLGKDVRISGILVSLPDSGQKITIDEIILHDMDDKSEVPAFLSLSCNGIALDIKNLGENAKRFQELGYNDKLMINIAADYAYDKEKKELHLKNLGIGADEAGEIRVNFRLGNMDIDPGRLFGLIFTFPQIILHEVNIVYTDDTLTERFMKLGAAQEQTDIKAFKKSIIQDVEEEIEKESDAFTKGALREIKAFLEDPEKFSISVSPAKPQTLDRIMQIERPIDAIKLLNIKISS